MTMEKHEETRIQYETYTSFTIHTVDMTALLLGLMSHPNRFLRTFQRASVKFARFLASTNETAVLAKNADKRNEKGMGSSATIIMIVTQMVWMR